jgi:hypothetical protein
VPRTLCPPLEAEADFPVSRQDVGITTRPSQHDKASATGPHQNLSSRDNLSVDAKSEAEAHALQRVLENLSGDGCRERGSTMVTAEDYEVSLPGRLESFQPPRHKARLRLETAPLKPKCGPNGRPALGPAMRYLAKAESRKVRAKVNAVWA